MSQQQPGTMSSRGFFKISPFRLWSTILLIVISVVALTPWAYYSTIGQLPIINLLLVVIMVLGFAVLLIDLVVTRPTNTEKDERNV